MTADTPDWRKMVREATTHRGELGAIIIAREAYKKGLEAAAKIAELPAPGHITPGITREAIAADIRTAAANAGDK